MKVTRAGMPREALRVETRTSPVTAPPELEPAAAIGVRRPRNPVREMDVAGVVEAIGEKVTAFKTGDEVFGAGEGSFAEFARASAKNPRNERESAGSELD